MLSINDVVEAYAEDRILKGPGYAKERLGQKIEFTGLDKEGLLNAVVEWEENSKRKLQREQHGYKFVVGLAMVGFVANLGLVLAPSLPVNVRIFYCCFVSAAFLLGIRFINFSRKAARRLYAEADLAQNLRKDLVDLVA